LGAPQQGLRSHQGCVGSKNNIIGGGEDFVQQVNGSADLAGQHQRSAGVSEPLATPRAWRRSQ
jgi:hypothetical protein